MTASRRVFGLLLLGCLTVGPGPLRAQDDEPKGVEYPFQLVQVAGIERLQQKADAMFLAAERPEMSDLVAGWMQTTLQELKGWDRTKPFGMMFYIKPGLTPGITTISFLPISNVDELLQTLAGPTGQIRELSGQNGRYELLGVNWGPNELAARRIGDYLFIAENNDAIELDRKFPSPERLVSRLAAKYDASYSLLLKNLPKATKTIFVEFFKNSALAGLQQRDDEPDAAYRIRRANGESIIDFLDRVINQGEEITLGALADAEKQTAAIEAEISGTRDSGLAKFFQDQAGRRSYFSSVVDEAATLTMNLSWQLDKKQRKVFTELFTLGPEIIDEQSRKEGNPGALSAFQPVFRSLLATAEDGHLDLFAQISGQEATDYRIVGGFRILGGSGFPEAITQALQFIKAAVMKRGGGERDKVFAEAKLSDEMLSGHPLHVLPMPSPPDKFGQAMFGPAPNVYVYATPQAFWLAYGGESAKEHLTKSVQHIDSPAEETTPKPTPAPFLLITHAQQWVSTRLTSGEDVEKDPGLGMQVAAFTADNDELRMTGRPTDNGARIRVELQSGFFSWIGRNIAGQIDSSVERAMKQKDRTERRRDGKATPAPK